MTNVFVPGVYRDRTTAAFPKPPRPAAPPLEEIPAILEIPGDCGSVAGRPQLNTVTDLHIKVAGFGGQGVLLLGELLAEAGLESGLDVSWLPSYGPEMRSGTSNCHVRISSCPVDSPVVSRPNVLLAMNEPSLRKFLPTVASGGWVFYNGDSVPEEARRDDVQIVALPFSDSANQLGATKAANIVMLGAFLSSTGALSRELVDRVLSRRIQSSQWLEIDRKALDLGIELAKGGVR
jgi:Pyruvate/2-oxoacid:ferredoxin oxidoreductase gamma subunit